MSLTQRFICDRITKLAYKLADHEATAPSKEVIADFEQRIFDAWNKNGKLLDRLEKYFITRKGNAP